MINNINFDDDDGGSIANMPSEGVTQRTLVFFFPSFFLFFAGPLVIARIYDEGAQKRV